MKNNVKELIEKYLQFIGNEKEVNKLIIEVDDIDLNTKYAYEMIEQIRKYLIIPNVIVLMAVKIEQLSQIVEKNYCIEFKELLKDNIKENSNISYEDIINMTEKYIVKFIPLERRIYLPKLDDIGLNRKLLIENLDEISGIDNGNDSIEKIIRLLIYKKTGMMFFNIDDNYSYILPRNLREIVNLISFLGNMGEDELENLERFKEYFLNNWVKSHLNKEKEKMILEILNNNVKEKNKYVVRTLNEIYLSEIRNIDKDRRRKEFKEIVEAENYIVDFLNNPFNISIRDIVMVFKIVIRVIKEEKDKKFIFAIKTIYDFILYEKVTRIKKENNKLKLINFENTESVEEIKINLKKIIKEYKILLGGALYNSDIDKVFEVEFFKDELEEIVGLIEKSENKNEIFKLFSYFISDLNESFIGLGNASKRSRINRRGFIKRKNKYVKSLIEMEENFSEKEIVEKVKYLMKIEGIKLGIFGFLRNGWELDEIENKTFYIANMDLYKLLLEESYNRNEEKKDDFVSKLLFNVNKLGDKYFEILQEYGFKKYKIEKDSLILKINLIIENLSEKDLSLLNEIFKNEESLSVVEKNAYQNLITEISKERETEKWKNRIRENVKNKLEKENITKKIRENLFKLFEGILEKYPEKKLSKDDVIEIKNEFVSSLSLKLIEGEING